MAFDTLNAKTPGFILTQETNLNLETLDLRSTTIDLGPLSSVVTEVIITGTPEPGVIQLECSCDNVTYYDVSGGDITAAGLSTIFSIGVRYLRAYVKTAAAATATFSLTTNIKT